MENYKLEKEYKISFELFREAYLAFQKKFVYPKSYVVMGIFLLLAVNFIAAAVKDPSNYLVYLLISVCIALAAREWYNPRKLRSNLSDVMREIGEPLYKIGIGDNFVDISTIEEPDRDISEETAVDIPDEIDPLPEKTRINIDEKFKVIEYDRFFLIFSGREMFYILPKEGFDETELELIRSLHS